jgi:osmoprotectant transport system substrate-binding protein
MKRGLVRGALLPLALAVALAACGALGLTRPVVRVGSTNFAEQLILAELYAQVLERNGYRVERKLNLGSREVVAPALESGQIDLYPEYLATYTAFVTRDPRKASPDPVETQSALQAALKPKGLSALDYAPAVNTNGFVVTQATAQRYGLKNVSDLARANGQLVFGGPPECPTRPFCLLGLQLTYGLRFKDFRALDAGGPLTVAALEQGQVDVAELFTTDAAIQVKSFVLLVDDKHLQQADNVVPVVRDDLLSRAPDDFERLVNGVTARVTTEELIGLNRQVGVEKRSPREVAAEWLRATGLVG